jgi:hypothetical protein
MKKLGIFMIVAIVAISFIAAPISVAEAQTSDPVLVAKSDKANNSSNSKAKSDKKSNNSKSDKASKSGSEKSNDKPSNNNQKDNKNAKEQQSNYNKPTAENKSISKQDKNNQIKKAKDITNISSEDKEKLQKKLKERKEKNNTKELSDVKEHWAEKHISKSQKMGLISGYQDGTFKPEHTITMAEAMVMSVRLGDLLDLENDIAEDATNEQSEQDINEDETTEIPDWAKDSAKKAIDKNIINLNRFHSEVQASRAETAVMLAKAMNLEPVNTTEVAFSDSIHISPEDVGYILALKEAGIVKGTADGKFNPNSAVTRAEFAAMLDRIIGQVDEEEPVEETTEEDEQNNTEEGEKVIVDDQKEVGDTNTNN